MNTTTTPANRPAKFAVGDVVYHRLGGSKLILDDFTASDGRLVCHSVRDNGSFAEWVVLRPDEAVSETGVYQRGLDRKDYGVV